ncbi:MAG: hypothetical protein MUF15_21655 [Acidobacteria bacterium]|jgi:hypothetical protein|nr:hypothetical protein [Acidobacteriota bacterium]
MNDNHTISHNLFSIDVEAHLQKAASHTFGSSSHYPVELVRAALRRGATEIDIRVKNTYIQVTDNGPGLDAEALHMLTTLMDPTQPADLKETAVQILQTRIGFGLLAIFAPNPVKILVESISDQEKMQVIFEKGNFKKINSCNINVGTRITLFRSMGRSSAQEKYILEAYCRPVQAGIRLNNRLISHGPLLDLTQLLASLDITNSNYIPRGVIGLPRTGDICRLWLLDQGIPYRYVTFPAYKGFIFYAAIEYVDIETNTSNGEITGELLDHLAKYAFQLYQWLCRNHESTPAAVQARMEELIFDHHRFIHSQSSAQKKISRSLLENFASFKALGTSKALTLAEIKKQCHKSPVYAVPRHKENLRYNILEKMVLSLTREQADLLLNLEKLPISFLAPVYRKEKRLPVFFYLLKKRLKRFLFNVFGFLLIPSRDKVLHIDQLTPREQFFIHAVNEYLAGQEEGKAGEAVMVSSKGLFPSIPSWPLLIRREHPLVQKAAAAVQSDPRNIEIFMPLLFDNRNSY